MLDAAGALGADFGSVQNGVFTSEMLLCQFSFPNLYLFLPHLICIVMNNIGKII